MEEQTKGKMGVVMDIRTDMSRHAKGWTERVASGRRDGCIYIGWVGGSVGRSDLVSKMINGQNTDGDMKFHSDSPTTSGVQ